MSTASFSAKDIKRNWHFYDIGGKILGRAATDIAKVLMGKNKQTFVTYLDNGDYVVVTNASKVIISGKKAQSKKYVRHSGYPGGLKVESFDKLLKRKPEEIVRHAVLGMMPKNRLGRSMIKKLYIYSDENHPFKEKERKTND